MEELLIDTKICCRCKKELPLTEKFFHVSNFLLDGFNSHCKECRQKSYHLRRKPENNLEKLLNQRIIDLKTRTKKKRVKYDTILDFDLGYLLHLWIEQGGRCAISNIEMTHILYDGHNNTNVSIDRINSTKGYTKDNIQLVCSIINKMKLDMTIKELTYYCNKILTHNGL